MSRTRLLVMGASGGDDIPGFERITAQADVVFASSVSELRSALPGTDAVLGWSFRDRALVEAWEHADRLRWIHWCGAGVDAALFPALAASDVVLTNSRGAFDRAMAEYTLGMVIAMAKDFVTTVHAQKAHEWNYRHSELLRGSRALMVGAGSISREVARLLRAIGIHIEAVSRTARVDDPDLGTVHPLSRLHERLGQADWVIAVVPLTAQSTDMFGAAEFAAMKPTARFINLGRGQQVNEGALVDALRAGTIAGAALDVFREEPLPAHSPLWDAPGLFISPHMSGDFHGYRHVVIDIFLDNLARFGAGETLRNVVDKQAGYVPAG